MNVWPIQSYGLIGNMRSAALVSDCGSVDFFCFPKFDSPTVFAALLDPEKGGFFSLGPEQVTGKTKQMYLPDTNVLLTRFLSDEGIVEVTDFMPLGQREECHCLMRRVSAIGCAASLRLQCSPRFNYARSNHQAERRPGIVAFSPESRGSPPLFLLSSASVQLDENDASASFALKSGESAYFLFGTDQSQRPLDELAEFVEECLQATLDYWRKWSAKSTYKGRWREMVNRSALVLKLLTSAEYGSWIAAPTFGLPEAIGGSRNWDYRYAWLRDSSFSLYALMRLGHTEEGLKFGHWLRDRLRFDGEQGPLQVAYGIDGRIELIESEFDHLAGYRGSKPVRIGNDAFRQLQLDIYGEVFDAIYLMSKYGDAPPYEDWQRMKQVLKWLAGHWHEPDNGIWEFRGERQQFLHSRLMCWVAFDRGIRLGQKRSLAGPYEWMEECRDAIVRDIHENFWDDELKTFVQYKGAKEVDASTLLMPLMRFTSPTDPRWLSTLNRIERELSVDMLVQRYRPNNTLDSLKTHEGSFTACSFWFIEALARSRQVDKAHSLFEKMLESSNQLGLYSEELSPTGDHLGNYPQALTHLALISAATYLDRRLEGGSGEAWS